MKLFKKALASVAAGSLLLAASISPSLALPRFSAPLVIGSAGSVGVTANIDPVAKTVSGRVTSPFNVSGLTVYIFLDGSGVSFGSAVTDVNGNYTASIALAPAGNHAVSASATVSQSGTGSSSTVLVATGTATYLGAGQHYYVAANGSDANNGTSPSTPWATTAKVNSFVFTPNDTISFNGGDSITGCLTFKPTNVPNSFRNNLFTVNSYGTGKGTIVSNCPGTSSGANGPRTAAVIIDGVSGFTWDSLNVAGSGTSTPTQYGILVENDNSGVVADTITIENSDITGFMTLPSATADSASEIQIIGLSQNNVSGSLTNVKVLNNTLHGASVSAPDDNGISGYGAGQNIYNVLYQGNTIFNMGGRATSPSGASGNGMIANGVNGGIEQYNVVHDSGWNVRECGGPGGVWAYSANAVKIQYNEVYNMQPSAMTGLGGACDWIAYDLDSRVTNSFVQYNYSHDNAGPGLLAFTSGGGTWTNNTYRYNVSQDDNKLGNDGGGSIALNPASGLYVYNNTIYKNGANYPSSQTPGSCWSTGYNGSYSAPVIVANNLCYNGLTDQYGRNRSVDGTNGAGGLASITLVANDYYNASGGSLSYGWNGTLYSSFAAYQASTGGETGSVTGNPLIASVTTGLVCGTIAAPQTCPPGYKLGVGSAAVGTGVNLAAAPYNLTPVQDYFGNAIPISAVNIGAYQGPGVNVLQNLVLSQLKATTNNAWSATISGRTTGSTITATSSDGTALTVSGNTVSGTFTAAGTPTVTLSEALANAVPNPKTSTASIAVTIPPTFAWNFLTGTLPSGVTATGGANGTTTNASNAVVAATDPRFVYSGGVVQGIRVEAASTNLVTQSNTAAGTAWGTFANGSGTIARAANAAASPDGTVDAALITINRTAAGDFAQLSTSAFPGNTTTGLVTVWFKADTSADVGKKIYLGMYDANQTTYGGYVPGGISVTLTSTWTRYSAGGTLTSNTGVGVLMGYEPNNSGGGVVNLPQTGVVNFDVWNAQVEEGIPTATSDIFTTTAALTRSADVVSGTIPANTGHITYNFADGTSTTVTAAPGAFTIPTNLGKTIASITGAN